MHTNTLHAYANIHLRIHHTHAYKYTNSCMHTDIHPHAYMLGSVDAHGQNPASGKLGAKFGGSIKSTESLGSRLGSPRLLENRNNVVDVLLLDFPNR
jgi:hypothetical protein